MNVSRFCALALALFLLLSTFSRLSTMPSWAAPIRCLHSFKGPKQPIFVKRPIIVRIGTPYLAELHRPKAKPKISKANK